MLLSRGARARRQRQNMRMSDIKQVRAGLVAGLSSAVSGVKVIVGLEALGRLEASIAKVKAKRCGSGTVALTDLNTEGLMPLFVNMRDTAEREARAWNPPPHWRRPSRLRKAGVLVLAQAPDHAARAAARAMMMQSALALLASVDEGSQPSAKKTTSAKKVHP